LARIELPTNAGGFYSTTNVAQYGLREICTYSTNKDSPVLVTEAKGWGRVKRTSHALVCLAETAKVAPFPTLFIRVLGELAIFEYVVVDPAMTRTNLVNPVIE
jgi:hypothetical protein